MQTSKTVRREHGKLQDGIGPSTGQGFGSHEFNVPQFRQSAPARITATLTFPLAAAIIRQPRGVPMSRSVLGLRSHESLAQFAYDAGLRVTYGDGILLPKRGRKGVGS